MGNKRFSKLYAICHFSFFCCSSKNIYVRSFPYEELLSLLPPNSVVRFFFEKKRSHYSSAISKNLSICTYTFHIEETVSSPINSKKKENKKTSHNRAYAVHHRHATFIQLASQPTKPFVPGGSAPPPHRPTR